VKQKTKVLQEYYDHIAPIYDEATSSFQWKAPLVIRKLLSPRLKQKRHYHILDIGIGTGQSSEYFYNKGHHITGIDISAKMVRLAKKKLPKAKLYCTNIERKPPRLPQNKFDAVIASGSLEFVRDLPNAIKWSNDILKTDGLFCFTFDEYLPRSTYQRWKVAPVGKGFVRKIPKQLSFPVYRRTLQEVQKMLKQYGFRFLKQERFSAYAKGKQRKVSIVYRAVLAEKL